MKDYTKAIISLLLTCSFILFAAACSERADEKEVSDSPDVTADVSQTEEETEKPYDDNLPDGLYFDDMTVRLITSDRSSFETVEEPIDVVDTAVYNRNTKLQERLGFKFDMIIDDVNFSNVPQTFERSVKAASDDYDIFAGYSYSSVALATSGYVLNLADAPYIDLSAPYWGDKFISAMSYRDYIYWLTGDISLTYTNGIYATYVNYAKWNDVFTGEDLYEIARDGKWTLEELIEHSNAAFSDLDGNGKCGKNDFIGFIYTTEDPIDGMSIAAGVKYTEYDEEGIPQLAIIGSEKAIKFGELLTKLCTGDGSYLSTSDDCASSFTAFGSCNVMFTVGRVKHAQTYLRDMVDDFALIPPPKLDESQETYLTTLHDGTTVIGIPKTISEDKYEASCAILEAMAAESAKNMTPVYLDTALKNKYTRDEESAEMIDLIRQNIVSDFGFIYTETGFNNFFRQYTKKGDTIASTIAKNEKSWSRKLEKILTALENNA